MFEIVYDDGRTTDGRRLDGYTISSPCEPNGSGELKSEKMKAMISLHNGVTADLYHRYRIYTKGRFSHETAELLCYRLGTSLKTRGQII